MARNVAVVLLTAALAARAVASGSGYACQSEWKVPGGAVAAEKKGICLDDTTFSDCPNEIPTLWPNADAPIKHLRMFGAWKSDWEKSGKADRVSANNQIVNWAVTNNAKILVGVDISCYPAEDEKSWQWAKELLKKLGPQHVVGVAFGNELDLLWTQAPKFNISADCMDSMWGWGQPDQGMRSSYLYRRISDWVPELDAMPEFQGAETPVTTVLSGFGGFQCTDCSEESFINGAPPPKPSMGHIMVDNAIKNLTLTFGRRYAHSLNIYPYFDFDGNTLDFGSWSRCSETTYTDLCFNKRETGFECQGPGPFNVMCRALSHDTCGLNPVCSWIPKPEGKVHEHFDCKFFNQAVQFRKNIKKLTGRTDDTFWITEFGWSYPAASTLVGAMSHCSDFATREAFVSAYQGWLTWDVSLPGEDVAPPNLSFYFTIRDSVNFGKTEGFGLIGSCGSSQCKLDCHQGTCPAAYCWANASSSSYGDKTCMGIGMDVKVASLLAGVLLPVCLVAGGLAIIWWMLKALSMRKTDASEQDNEGSALSDAASVEQSPYWRLL